MEPVPSWRSTVQPSDLVAGARGQRVLLGVGFRGGEFLLDLVEAPEELADGLGAVGLGELGGVADQGVHRRG